jgi:hypothetical protein
VKAADCTLRCVDGIFRPGVDDRPEAVKGIRDNSQEQLFMSHGVTILTLGQPWREEDMVDQGQDITVRQLVIQIRIHEERPPKELEEQRRIERLLSISRVKLSTMKLGRTTPNHVVRTPRVKNPVLAQS